MEYGTIRRDACSVGGREVQGQCDLSSALRLEEGGFVVLESHGIVSTAPSHLLGPRQQSTSKDSCCCLKRIEAVKLCGPSKTMPLYGNTCSAE